MQFPPNGNPHSTVSTHQRTTMKSNLVISCFVLSTLLLAVSAAPGCGANSRMDSCSDGCVPMCDLVSKNRWTRSSSVYLIKLIIPLSDCWLHTKWTLRGGVHLLPRLRAKSWWRRVHPGIAVWKLLQMNSLYKTYLLILFYKECHLQSQVVENILWVN